ncbi:phosphotransferase enzyme family protein [Haliscomenobacter sp.]|uniref:phosphotransferase enzyme family protein n=1 Tax=Haliscomenobacter sp. TaxID=2717303 RepID=UPI003593BCC2
MQTFPVSSSILSTEALGHFLRKKYDLSAACTCQLIKAGINHTYFVKDQSLKWIFRVYSLNWRSRLEIAEEMRLLTALRDAQIPVSHPMPDAEGEYIQTLVAPEGERFGVLFSYAEGDKLHNFSTETHFEIGAIMARLHQVTQNFKLERVSYSPEVLLINSTAQFQPFLPHDCAEMDFIKSTQKYLLEYLANIQVQELRTGAVHLDIWFDNLNVSKTGEVTIFDFDFCGNGWLCLDVAYYVLQVHSVERDKPECLPKVQSFIRGYESVTPLSAEEKRVLPMLGVCLYFFYLGIQSQRFENWSNTFFNESYLKRFINVLVKSYFELYTTNK